MSRRKVHHSTVPASRPVREPRRLTPRPRRSEAPVPPARVLPPGPQPRPETPAFAASHETSLAEVIDNLLNRGVVLNADLILALADVDLVYVRLSALLCAADRILPGPR